MLAAGVIAVRNILGKHRAPYPYEYLSWLVVYGGIGIIPDSQFSSALAWAYLGAIVLAPSFADVVAQLEGAHLGSGGTTGTSGRGGGTTSTTPTTPAHISPHTGQVG